MILPGLSPKHNHPSYYNYDGTGRDTYIGFNNGGNYPPQPRLIKKDPSLQCILVFVHLTWLGLISPKNYGKP